MLDFTWKIFCMTGNIDTYLLMKEIESENQIAIGERENGNSEPEIDPTFH